MDPRVKTPIPALQQQLMLSRKCYKGQNTCVQLSKEIIDLISNNKKQNLSTERKELDSGIALLQNNTAKGALSFAKINGDLAVLNGVLQDADVAPAKRTVDAVEQSLRNLKTLEEQWKDVKQKKLQKLK